MLIHIKKTKDKSKKTKVDKRRDEMHLCDLCVKSLRPLRLMDIKDVTFELKLI